MSLKNAKKLKIIAVSLWMLATTPAWAELGSLHIQSALGEPFAGSITVNGDEAAALLQGQASLSGAPLQTRVSRQQNATVIYLRSIEPIRDPVFSFSLQVGNQARRYTALLDPPTYKRASKNRSESGDTVKRSAFRAEGMQVYQTGPNENLIDVARRVQPGGLNLAQTMRALVLANPHAFRNHNPDFMYREVKLRIPSAAQMRELSKVKPTAKPKAKIHTARHDARSANQDLSPMPTDTVHNSPVGDQPSDTTPSKPNNDDVTANTASVPEGMEPPVGQTDSAEAQMSSDATDLMASAVSATDSAASAIIVPADKPKPVAAPVPAAASAENNGWLQYALIGGGSVVVLLLALLLWQRRRNQVQDDDEADEDFDADDQNDSVTFVDVETLPKQSNAAQAKPEATVAKTAPATTKAEENTVTPATESAEDNDWSWLESADISQDLNAFADETDPKQSVKPAQEVKAAVAEQTAPVEQIAAVNQANTNTTNDDSDWLNFNFDQDQDTATVNATAATTEADEVSSVSEDTELSDLDWLHEEDNHAATESAPLAAESSTEQLEWVVAEESEPSAPIAAESVTPEFTAVAESEADGTTKALDMDSLGFEVDPAIIDKPAGSAATQSGAEAANTPSSTSMDIDWDALNLLDKDESADASNQAAPAAETTLSAEEAYSSADSGAPSFDSAAVDKMMAAEEHASPFATGKVDYDDYSAKALASEKQLSETEMAIPLQAKLELAQMYLEMDDAVTARQTLRELLDEANGEVLAKAQQLLQQLGG